MMMEDTELKTMRKVKYNLPFLPSWSSNYKRVGCRHGTIHQNFVNFATQTLQTFNDLRLIHEIKKTPKRAERK